MKTKNNKIAIRVIIAMVLLYMITVGTLRNMRKNGVISNVISSVTGQNNMRGVYDDIHFSTPKSVRKVLLMTDISPPGVIVHTDEDGKVIGVEPLPGDTEEATVRYEANYYKYKK